MFTAVEWPDYLLQDLVKVVVEAVRLLVGQLATITASGELAGNGVALLSSPRKFIAYPQTEFDLFEL